MWEKYFYHRLGNSIQQEDQDYDAQWPMARSYVIGRSYLVIWLAINSFQWVLDTKRNYKIDKNLVSALNTAGKPPLLGTALKRSKLWDALAIILLKFSVFNWKIIYFVQVLFKNPWNKPTLTNFLSLKLYLYIP